MSSRPSMHDTIPLRKETSTPAATACSWEANPRPLQPRPEAPSRQNPLLRLSSEPRTRTDLHETFPSGRDTGRPSMWPANNKHKIPDDRAMLQGCAQASESLQPSQDHGGNAPAGLKCLARNSPHLPLDDSYEQAGSSGLQLQYDSTPHATFSHDILQLTTHTTNAKPRLLSRSELTNMPAKKGMGQPQLNQKMGNLQKKNPAESARRHEKAPTLLQAQPARPHPLEDGNEQAGSNSLQPGGESTPHAALAQCTL